MRENAFQSSLFLNDFLLESITSMPDWAGIQDGELKSYAHELRAIFDRFPTSHTHNESQTEDDLIWPVLKRLGWTATLRQQNLAPRGREDVPDGLLFKDAATKAKANAFREEWRRYEFGLAVVESKRWQRPLDRRSGRRGEETAPSTQMLRYLRRVEDLTTGKLRWGILTNGGRWRRPAAVRWRPVRSQAHTTADAGQARRRRHGDCHRRSVLRTDAQGPQIHQLPRPQRSTARLHL